MRIRSWGSLVLCTLLVAVAVNYLSKGHTMKKTMESIWNYPRPPALQKRSMEVVVQLFGKEIVRSSECFTICETSHPPTWYIPPSAFPPGVLKRVPNKSTFCEWKGVATYWDLHVDGKVLKGSAWSYEDINPAYKDVQGYIALYPAKMDLCTVDGEKVIAQQSDFYGGWLTPSWVDVGEKGMKGPPGTQFW